MARTAQQLVRELGTRLREMVLSSPQGTGTQTQLVDTALRQFFPTDIAQWNGWIYGTSTADALNIGQERRGTSWTQGNATVTLFAPGFPGNITSGQYEIHMRWQRARLLEAINAAVGQLALSWFREAIDETVLTAVNTWKYTPPAAQHWSNISKVEIQWNTDPTQIGYPYADASYLNWRPRRSVDVLGNETWVIDFGVLPPPGRLLRIYGEGWYPDLAVDTDVLGLGGKWERPALEWIFSYATYDLKDWLTNAAPTAEAEKLRQQSLDQLERQKNQLLASAPAHRQGRIVTPGRGDAEAYPSPEDWRWLGAFKSSTFTRGGS